MKVLFYLGWLFLIAAFCAAAAEPFLSQVGHEDLLTASYDLWYALAPGNLVVTEIRMQKNFPGLWDHLLRPMLNIPGWLLAGAPGVFLTWYCRPNRIMSVEVREEYERQKESLFVIDQLSRNAREEEDYDPREDDQAPVHMLFDLEPEDDEDILKNLEEDDTPAGYPPQDYVEEYLRDLTQDREEVSLDDLDLEESDSDAPPPEPTVRIVDGLAFTDSVPLKGTTDNDSEEPKS